MTVGDDLLDNEIEEEIGQIIQPDQMTPTPIQENEIQEGEPEATDPPPPPPDGECDAGFTGNDYPTKYWCAFPQRIDTDGPHPEIVWNTGDWELPYGSLQAEQGDQVAIRLPDSFPTPQIVFTGGQLMGK